MRRLGFALAVLVMLVVPVAMRAHPTSSTFVVVRIPGDDTVVVDVTMDARALRVLSPDMPRLSELEIDGLAARWLRSNETAVPERPELATLRLQASLPAGAKAVRWRSSFLTIAYPIAVIGGPDRPHPEAYEWIAGREWSRSYALDELQREESPWQVAVRLVPTGFTHILPAGLDHVLFMLGLFLMASTRRALLIQVSAFTVAHSLTLALGVLGTVAVPSRVVEPLIAASIAFIAIENILTTSISRRRIFVVCVFGLLHGLGFAGAMSGLGLSKTNLVASIVGFNLGVEAGQLAVILIAALIVRGLRLPVDAERQFVLRPASAAIALIGLFWAFERTIG